MVRSGPFWLDSEPVDLFLKDFMRLSSAARFALSGLLVFAVEHAAATLTYADARAVGATSDVFDFQSETGGAGGARASASQDLVAHAEASSFAGGLRASSLAQGGRDAQARAYAYWADGFAFEGNAYATGTVGTFTSGVAVQGGLLAEYLGRAYADAYVVANYWLDTGVPNGYQVAQGGGRRTGGYDIGSTSSGQESFALIFENVPFAFGRAISVSMALRTIGGITSFAEDTSATASAEYSHTMTWLGITNVRDASGRLLTDFTAVSADSGFDFMRGSNDPVSVPEPASCMLIAIGLLMLVLNSVIRKPR